VFVATSDKQEPGTSPFSFGDKQLMMTQLGIPASHVVQVRNPYQAQEITKDFDPENTVLVFALSDKDAERISFKPKRDGSPSYLQPFPEGGKGLRPMKQHGYALLTPRVDFKVQGVNADSASQIRDLYSKSNDAGRDQILADLYGQPDGNLRKIFDLRLNKVDENEIMNETVLINDPESGIQLRPAGGMGTYSVQSLHQEIARKIADLSRLVETNQYRALYQVIYDRGVLKSMIQAMADLEKFRERQGRRPVARGKEMDITADYLEERDLEEDLRKWFKEKWVPFGPDGKIRGDCARGDDSEGKPKCLPQSKAQALGKKGRASAAARKRREDPNPERSGKAINVNTKKKTDEAQLDERCWDTHKQVGMKKKGDRMVPNCVPKESVEETHQQCPECGGALYEISLMNEKQDACYYKVKSRYKVWPSAYASGALVQCRKKGAKNWGNKKESVDSDQLDEKWSEQYKRSINCANPKGFSQRAHCQGRKKNESVQESLHKLKQLLAEVKNKKV